MAQWLPGLIQACMLPYAAQGHVHEATYWGAVVTLASAALLCVVALMVLQVTLWAAEPSVHATANNPSDQHERCKTIGHVLRKPGGWRWVWHERVLVLAPMALLIFTAEATYTFLIVLSPRLPIAGGSAANPFWATYQVTLLIMASNTFAFFGRTVGLRAVPSLGIDARVLFWWCLSPTAALVGLLYWSHRLPLSHATPLVLYAATALVNGFTLVLLNKSSQAGLLSARTGRHHIDWNPCPIAAQLVWFSVQIGAFVPAFLVNFL
mmetsp:Transcript_27620/g.70367  ORF Transcript_27620/g.70367 Transcript_27620/m.70367 type:complete len:265 (-) Transcript_27620:352-1146(-)